VLTLDKLLEEMYIARTLFIPINVFLQFIDLLISCSVIELLDVSTWLS